MRPSARADAAVVYLGAVLCVLAVVLVLVTSSDPEPAPELERVVATSEPPTPSPTASPTPKPTRAPVATPRPTKAAARPVTPPQAAPAAVGAPWGALADCESGHRDRHGRPIPGTRRWHLVTGNGYYGGLQFADGTWDGFGGEQYAPTADLATPQQQIAIARKVQAVQGWGAWPSCSRMLGLR